MKRKIICSAVLAGFVLLSAQAQTSRGRSVSSYEEMVGNLSNQLRLMQDENAKLAGTVYSLKQEVQELKQRMQSIQSENAEMRKLISSEADARKKQLGDIADKIQKAGEAAAAQSAAERKQKNEEFDYYVVQPGATLSAVSRATGVSIPELKKANGMTNDVLRVGQKLKIPRN